MKILIKLYELGGKMVLQSKILMSHLQSKGVLIM